jgi:small subunit ribosomal protein S3
LSAVANRSVRPLEKMSEGGQKYMGHKVSPKIFRIGINEKCDSQWFGYGKKFIEYLTEDEAIRVYLRGKLKDGGLEKIEIERSLDKINIIVYASKPGVVIGRGGTGIEDLKKYILKKIFRQRLAKEGKVNFQINIREVDKPNMSAGIVAQNIATDMEKRMPFRRSMKRGMELVMKNGAEGVKIICSGRLDGAEIARRESLSIGKIPLHTLRAKIDHAKATALTTYGTVGVKVWIYKGEVFGK